MLLHLVLSALCFLQNCNGAELERRGRQFIGFDTFSSFTESKGSEPGERVLISREIVAQIRWDELIVSWNVEKAGYLTVEARALWPDHASRYYTLAHWSTDTAKHPRESVLHQKDEDADVSTDTLVLKAPCERMQLRLTLGADQGLKPKLKFVGLCFANTRATPEPLPPNQRAWGKTLAVPERSQMDYPNGKVLCSPTTMSMLLSFWSQTLSRPELDCNVPQVATGVYDSNWRGTGNWPFNTAFAGGYPGIRSYVSRLSDISELEAWIASGIPVGLSLCYDKLRGKQGPPNGHLVVCVGFTSEGDPIINDPGTSRNVRKTFPRRNLTDAWAVSHNTVYLVYPDSAKIPTDQFEHWDGARKIQ
jgi:hypothetical protein